MSYEFKKISDVNVIESIDDNANILVENNGEIAKIAASNFAVNSGNSGSSTSGGAPVVFRISNRLTVGSLDDLMEKFITGNVYICNDGGSYSTVFDYYPQKMLGFSISNNSAMALISQNKEFPILNQAGTAYTKDQLVQAMKNYLGDY